MPEPTGPPSIAGLRGPDLNDEEKLYPPLDVPSGASGAGDVRAATGGRSDLLSVISAEGWPKDFSKGFGSRDR